MILLTQTQSIDKNVTPGIIRLALMVDLYGDRTSTRGESIRGI